MLLFTDIRKLLGNSFRVTCQIELAISIYWRTNDPAVLRQMLRDTSESSTQRALNILCGDENMFDRRFKAEIDKSKEKLHLNLNLKDSDSVTGSEKDHSHGDELLLMTVNTVPTQVVKSVDSDLIGDKQKSSENS